MAKLEQQCLWLNDGRRFCIDDRVVVYSAETLHGFGKDTEEDFKFVHSRSGVIRNFGDNDRVAFEMLQIEMSNGLLEWFAPQQCHVVERQESSADPISEFEEHRVMSSFNYLFEFCETNPEQALVLMGKLVSDNNPHPASYSIFYLVGLINGILVTRKHPLFWRYIIAALRDSHKFLERLRPSDFLGSKRIYARGPGF